MMDKDISSKFHSHPCLASDSLLYHVASIEEHVSWLLTHKGMHAMNGNIDSPWNPSWEAAVQKMMADHKASWEGSRANATGRIQALGREIPLASNHQEPNTFTQQVASRPLDPESHAPPVQGQRRNASSRELDALLQSSISLDGAANALPSTAQRSARPLHPLLSGMQDSGGRAANNLPSPH